MIYRSPQFCIYFGDARDNISKEIDCVPQNSPLFCHPKFSPIIQQCNVTNLIFLNQTHSASGLIVEDSPITPFSIDGDYLITAQKNIGIGIMSADCLPIIFYDSKNQVIAAAHAGWKGTIAGIAPQTIHAMQEKFGTSVTDLEIFFGPSAKVCCYTVGKDFMDTIEKRLHEQIFKQESDYFYFDLPKLNSMLLQECGVDSGQINQVYNFCTMCNHQFFSYRRSGKAAGRQMTIVWLTI